MEITVIVPDELVSYLEAAMGTMPTMPGVPGSMDAVSAPVDLAARLKKQWESEVDQRVTSHLVQQAQADAAAVVTAAREAVNATNASVVTSKVVTSSKSDDSTETNTK